MKRTHFMQTHLLYKKIIEDCRDNDATSLQNSLENLITNSEDLTDGLLSVYKLALKQLGSGKLQDIQKNFERLLKAWTSTALKMKGQKLFDDTRDLEVDTISDKAFTVKVANPDVLYCIEDIHDITCQNEESLPTGEKLLSISLLTQSLAEVLSQITTPRYLDHIQKKRTPQLSFDF